MPPRQRTEAHVAHHVAGHFVARHVLLGASVDSLLRLTRDGEGGFVGAEPSSESLRGAASDRGRRDPAALELRVVVLFAGAAAELRFDPARQEEVRLAARGDLDLAAEWIGDGLGEPERAQELKLAAAALVARHWIAISAVAERLVAEPWIDDEKRLRGCAAARIVDRHEA